MTLSDYLRDRGLDDAAFASLSDGAFSAEAVRKWRFRARTPRQRQLAKIVELTNGAVTANDFMAVAPSTDEVDAA